MIYCGIILSSCLLVKDGDEFIRSINVSSLRDLCIVAFQKFPSAGGVSAGRGGFSFLGGRRSLTGWIMYPNCAPLFSLSPDGAFPIKMGGEM